ncbi:hypothetical protein SK128_008410, partial [Halocaridina rubra]
SWDAYDNDSKSFFKRQGSLTQSYYLKLIGMKETVDWMMVAKMVMQTNMTKESSRCSIVLQVEK